MAPGIVFPGHLAATPAVEYAHDQHPHDVADKRMGAEAGFVHDAREYAQHDPLEHGPEQRVDPAALFLAHPEGIEFKFLQDYRDELRFYYAAVAPNLDTERLEESVSRLVNPLDNAISEKCSRIKNTFLQMMDEYSASYYIVSSHTKKQVQSSARIWYKRLKLITLPRELVVWE